MTSVGVPTHSPWFSAPSASVRFGATTGTRSEHVEVVYGVHEAQAQWLGHKVRAELHVVVDRRLSVEAAHRIAERVHEALAEHVTAFGGATVHVCPCDHPEPAEGVLPTAPPAQVALPGAAMSS